MRLLRAQHHCASAELQIEPRKAVTEPGIQRTTKNHELNREANLSGQASQLNMTKNRTAVLPILGLDRIPNLISIDADGSRLAQAVAGMKRERGEV